MMKTFLIQPTYEAEGVGTGTGTGEGTGTGTGTPWYGTPDGDTLGYIQSRGLDKMTPDKAAMASIQAHREAEKLIGAPADQMIRFPKDLSDVEGWNKIHAKLGVPADAKEYDFSNVKSKSGNNLSDADQNTFRTMASELKIPKSSAALLVQKLVDIADKNSAETAAKASGVLAQEQDKLKENWGFKAAGNQVVAENAMRALGVTDEQMANMKGTVGYAATMEMFRNIGSRMGEGKFIENKGPDGNKLAMTKEEANYRLEALQNDSEWQKRFRAGGQVEGNEFNDLTRMASV